MCRLITIPLIVLCIAITESPVHQQSFAQDRNDREQDDRERGDRGRFDRGRFGGGRRGGFGGRRGGGFGGRGGGMFGLIQRDSTQEELKLNEEQERKIEELSERLSEKRRELFSGMRDAEPEDREQLFEKMRTQGAELQKEAELELKQMLTEEQVARLQQLTLHSSGIRSLENDEIASQLKLTEDQRTKIKELIETENESRRDRRGRRGGGSRADREEQRAEFEKNVTALLTEEQQQQWQEMLGPPPVDTDEERPNWGRQRERRGGRRTADESAAPSQPLVESQPTGEVVADLSSSESDTSPEQNSEKTDDGESLLSFNFRFAPWELVLRRIAEEAGLSLQIDVVPPGTLNYYDRKKYTPTQAIDVLNGYLLQKGYLLVHRDNFLVVVNIDNGIPPNLVPQVSIEELQNRGRNELVSIVVQLENAEAATVADEVKAMLGPQGKVVPMTNLNQLVITDTGGNLRRVHEMLTGGAEGRPKSQKFRAFPLKYIAASDAEKIVRDLFGLSARGATNVSASNSNDSRSSFGDRFGFRFGRDRDRGRDRGRDSRRDDDRGRSRSTTAPEATSTKVHLAVDERTNSLLVTASLVDLSVIEAAIRTIDVGDGPGGGAITSATPNRPQLEVYHVKSADPREVTKTLDSLLPGVVVNEDGRARRIHIFATPDEHRQIRAIINQLDGIGGEGVTVISLNRLDPIAATNTLRSLFRDQDGNTPTIEADVVGRRLLIRGSVEQLSQIKTLLSQLGEDGNPVVGRTTAQRGPIRTFSLGGRDGEELVKLLRQVWSASGSNPIRVVDPTAVTPAMRPGSEERSSRKPVAPSKPTADRRGVEFQSAVLSRETDSNESSEAESDLVDEELEQSESSEAVEDEELLDELDDVLDENEKENRASTEGGAPIVISPNGGNLIIASDDQEALDRVEKLLSALVRTAPRKRQWSVFYLRSSDALETASTLGELYPAGSVASPTSVGGTSLTGSLSSLGNNLMDLTGSTSLGNDGGTLRIIPETRLNALFVSGPANQIAEIENVLRILDGGDLPESLRDRVPRRIELQYADANDVAAIVRDVYKEEMEPPDRGRRGGRSSFGMMFTGGQQSGSSAAGEGVKLTLGVDPRTNALIVSANNDLFNQVSSMVKAIDESAKQANRTVRVVSIDRQSAPLIQQSLGSLFGKINVSTTSGTPTAGSQQSNTNESNRSQRSSSSASDDGRREEIRRFFERRFRDRSGRDRGDRGDRGDSGGRRSRRGRSESSGSGFPGARGRRDR